MHIARSPPLVLSGAVLTLLSSLIHPNLLWPLAVPRRLRQLQELIDGLHQFVAGRPQLMDAPARHLFQHSLPSRLQRDQHAAPIITPARPFHVPVRLHPVNQFDNAVVFQCETLRQGADGGFFALREPTYHQQQEVLLGLKPGGTRGGVSLAKEMTNEAPKLGQRAIFPCCDFGGHS
jgi:hypothetical protein